MVKTVIGIISYNDLHYLKVTLPALAKLDDSKIIILDNADNDEIKNFINKNYPEIDFIRHPDGNLGFGKGHNYINEKSPECKYYFCLNSDILLEQEGYNKCVEYLDKNPDTTMVSSKLYHWDFENNKKTNIIDTFGIVANRAHHFWDRGQAKKDHGQYDNSINNIFGISGAAFFIRRSDIKEILGDANKIFDENFFMYKEDVDLAYRLRWLGKKMQFLSDVLGYHDRTVGKQKKKSFFEAKMSFANHILMLRNNFSFKFSLGVIFHTLLYEKMKIFYYLFRNPKLLKELKKAFKIKIHKSKRKISPRKMQKFFLK